MKKTDAKSDSDHTAEKETGKKKYWTRKKVLYWANIISLILIIFFGALDSLLYYKLRENMAVTISVCIVIQIVITFLTLVIYYLSIIADSLRYRKKGGGDENQDQSK
ncbi:MAG: hypothetical protein LUE27_04520 [Clostridia bacterium]|nr:hypothetical protein [Clostridia bacterium]